MRDFLEELWFVGGGKKILWWVAALLIVIFLICMGGKFCMGKVEERAAVDRSTGPAIYAKESIDAITAQWDPQELLDRAGKSYKANTAAINEVTNLGKTKLGQLTRPILLRVAQSKSETDPELGRFSSATVVGTGEFAKGTADVEIKMTKIGGRWSIDSFTLAVYEKEK